MEGRALSRPLKKQALTGAARSKRKGQADKPTWPFRLKLSKNGRRELLRVTGRRTGCDRSFLLLCASAQAQGTGQHCYDHDRFE